VGIAKVAISSREYLAAVKPDGLFLILELMHFAQEVLEPELLKSSAGAELPPKELAMAKALVDAMTTEWEPARYQDRYRDAVMQMIEEKVQNRPAEALPAPAPRQPAGDIMAILQQSLQQTLGNKKQEAARGRTRGKSALLELRPKRRRSTA
jgi:DNA end-binding protein Ku